MGKHNQADASRQDALRRHEAAVEILRKSDADRAPFVLYLRKFDIANLHGPSEPQREFGEKMILDALDPGVKLITVQENSVGEVIRHLFAGSVPALLLGQGEQWKESLSPIINRAELIISEFVFLSEGVLWELNECIRLRKQHQTVLVLPPPHSPYATVDHLTPLDQFPRVFWANQFFTERLHKNFVVRDLLKRMEEIAALLPDERVRLYREGRMTTRFPFQYAEMQAGYQQRIRQWEAAGAFGEDFGYQRFWDRFRLGVTLGIQIRSGSLTLVDAAFDLGYSYIEILQGIAAGVVPLGQPESFLTEDYVLKIAGSVPKLISLLPEGGRWWLQRFAELSFERLGLQYDEANPSPD